MYVNQTLMGCSLLNIDGVSKRVAYSEFVNKTLQYGLEKSNFPDGPFFGPIYFNQTLRGCSSLNTRCVLIKVIYSESGKHILQPGSEIFDIHDVVFWTYLHRIT